MDTPTLEEFKASVREAFKAWWRTLGDNEVDEYLNSDEAMFEIKRRYETDKAKLESGKMTRDQFMIGVAGSVGQCLSLMY